MESRWLTTEEAAAALGVKPATLYAYVSRGLLTSRRAPDGRTSRFAADDVERLAGRGRRAARDARDAEFVIRSAVSDIRGGRLHYRGHEVSRLAGNRPFEDVAELLWDTAGGGPEGPGGTGGPAGRTGELAGGTGGPPGGTGEGRWRAPAAALAASRDAQATLPPHAALLERLRICVVVAAAWDPLRRDLRPEAVRVAGRGLLATMVDALPPRGAGTEGPRLAARLWPRLTSLPADEASVAALDGALVLLADHELAASTLAARVTASARADAYAVVDAGLAAVSGTRHGAATLAAEQLLDGLGPADDPGARLDAHLRGRDRLTGFGHFLYPSGDPRAGRLIALLRQAAPEPALRTFDAVVAAARERGLEPPTVDLALAALTRALGMPLGAGEAVFGIARTAGWLAHALEEYAEDRLIRPRAVYVGPDPA